MRGIRRLLAAAAALSCVLTLLVVPAVHAADERVIDRVVGNARFSRNGRAYHLHLRAAEDRVLLAVSRTRDPDGGGPLRAHQRHAYSFATGPEVVSATGDGARVATGERLAPWGRVTMDFAPRGAAEPDGRCNRERQPGRLRGMLRLRTNTAFGTIELTRLRGALITRDADCGPIVVDPYPTCPVPSWSVHMRHARNLNHTVVTRRAGRDVALLYSRRTRSLGMHDSASSGIVDRELSVRVPGSRVRFQEDLGRVTARGAAGTDVRGRMEFVAGASVRRRVEWCSFDREAVVQHRRGRVTGTMIFDFFIGADRSFEGRRLRARAIRTRNRDIR